jgi:hypothetical protein
MSGSLDTLIHSTPALGAMCGAHIYPLCTLAASRTSTIKPYNNYNDRFQGPYDKCMANIYCRGGPLLYAVRCFKEKGQSYQIISIRLIAYPFTQGWAVLSRGLTRILHVLGVNGNMPQDVNMREDQQPSGGRP